MKSIRTKIMVIIGGITILAMVISALITVNTVVSTVISDQEHISNLTTKSAASEIDEYFARYITKVEQMAADSNVRRTLTDVTTRENYMQLPTYEGTYTS